MTKPILIMRALLILAMILIGPPSVMAADAASIDHDVDAALKKLYETTPAARTLAPKAKAILLFPNIVKAGFLFGAQYGNGALRERSKTVGYYNIAAVSYGLQAGVQAFAYAMFFMNDSSLQYLKKAAGIEIGVGPSIVLVDAGMAKTLTTTTAKEGVYAFVFGQEGLMAGLGLQGSKITEIHP